MDQGQAQVRWWLPGLAGAAASVAVGWSFGACTQDDAFISFRYAQHLIEGHGLVYNVGERVEGFTNPLWTLLLAGVMGLGFDPVPASAVMGAACMAALTFTAATLAWRLGGPWAAVAAAAMIGVDPQAGLESVEGLETALYALLVTVAVGQLGRAAPGGHGASTVAFALAALTRPEAPMLAALAHFGLLVGDPEHRGARLRGALQAGALLGLQQAALVSARLWYYGEPLPNTFYAKVGGAAWARGLRYLGEHLQTHPGLWALAAIGLVIGLRAGGSLRLRAALLGAPLLGQLLYVAQVGGDFKPTGRFVMPVLGLMAGLAGLAVGRLGVRRSGMVLAGLLTALSVAAALRDRPRVATWAEERHANVEARRVVGRFLKANFPPDTLIAIHSAGAIPFYAALPTIDMWGLTDHHIARAPIPTMGEGLAGHEKGDPAYVFAREPMIYLPEDRVFTLRPWVLEVEPNFPADFAERYNSVSIAVEGRALNVWVRKGFLARLNGGEAAGPASP